MSYTCKKCSYKTQQFTDMVRHVNKRKFCIKKLDAYNYTDEEMLKMRDDFLREDNTWYLEMYFKGVLPVKRKRK